MLAAMSGGLRSAAGAWVQVTRIVVHDSRRHIVSSVAEIVNSRRFCSKSLNHGNVIPSSTAAACQAQSALAKVREASVMTTVRTAELFRRVDAFEHAWCLRLNRGCSQPAVRDLFAAISRLGDGVFWYTLIVLAARHLRRSRRSSGAAHGGRRLHRRGALQVSQVAPGARATLHLARRHRARHAGARSLQLPFRPHAARGELHDSRRVSSFPELAWLLVPFATLVATSRVVLGLHYPSDVAAGALIGAALAVLSMVLVPLVG